MANEPNDPTRTGKETSELEMNAKTQAEIWVVFAITILGGIATALLDTGQIPGGPWTVILTLVAGAAATITGKVAATRNYTTRRTQLKMQQIAAAANQDTENPTLKQTGS
jgi:hypothetical protein